MSTHTVVRTKSGTKYHVEGCRFTKRSKTLLPYEPKAGTLKPCSVCKPHLPASKRQKAAQSIGVETRPFQCCKHCFPHGGPSMTREQVEAGGFIVTPSGTKYHKGTCRFVHRYVSKLTGQKRTKVTKQSVGLASTGRKVGKRGGGRKNPMNATIEENPLHSLLAA